MNDAGRPPLARVNAIGNFWHGYYSDVTGWRSRAGSAMSGFSPSPAATAKLSVIDNRYDAHLVNFAMPAVATPASEAALGMERWNKAILHGRQKRYAINSLLGFGADGWPYKAPDGTVFFMRMVATLASPNVVEVRAGKLSPSFSLPTSVIASIEVPSLSLVDDLNFSPAGDKACGHGYEAETAVFWTNTYLLWAVEAAISGGGADSLPAAALTLIPEDDGAFVEGPGPQVRVMTTQWIPRDPVYTDVTETSRTVTQASYPVAVQDTQDGQPLFRSLFRSEGIYDRTIAITYGPDGSRQVLRVGNGLLQKYYEEQFVSGRDKVVTWPERWTGSAWVMNGSSTVLDSGGTKWSQVRVVHRACRLSRNDAIVAELVDDTTYYKVTGEVTQVTTSGNAYSGSVSCLNNIDVPLRVRRFAANVIGITIEATAKNLLCWAAAVGAATYGYPGARTLDGLRIPAVHPETGAMSDNIRMYF